VTRPARALGHDQTTINWGTVRHAFGIRRLSAATLVATALAVSSIAAAPAASADPDIPFEGTTNATIHLAKLDQTSTASGTFAGSVDLATGDVTADLGLDSTEISVDLFGFQAATVGVAVVPTAPLRAHIDLATLQITASMSFDIKLLYIRPFGLASLNLVGNRCTTREPITIDVAGTVDLATFSLNASGEFEIPRFTTCGIATPLISALVSGPGNTFTSGPAAAA
jgi:hypothetical protein